MDREMSLIFFGYLLNY